MKNLMHDTHATWDTINEYADNVLAPEARAEVERHLERCGECRAMLATLREFLHEVADAAPSIDPPEEVWRTLRADLERGKVVGLPRLTDPPRLWTVIPHRVRWALAAAAVVLVVASSMLTAVVIRGGSNTDDAITRLPLRSATEGSVIEVAQIERNYLESAVQLTQALEAARPRLSARTIEVVERNLAIIDAAIAESRAALVRDPGNRDLLDVLAGTYRQKLDLLRRAAQIASS
jgi:anti-sigma factor RsiW